MSKINSVNLVLSVDFLLDLISTLIESKSRQSYVKWMDVLLIFEELTVLNKKWIFGLKFTFVRRFILLLLFFHQSLLKVVILFSYFSFLYSFKLSFNL